MPRTSTSHGYYTQHIFALQPLRNYCYNSTFDAMEERAPSGITHMHRLSMRKFKFQGTTDVFMQCKIRACAMQPCGICTGLGDWDRRLQAAEDVDLSPSDGEMFAPPVKIKIARNDKSALVFQSENWNALATRDKPLWAANFTKSAQSHVHPLPPALL